MATKAQDQNVDLFGNSTLTPRQLMQRQLSALLEDTAARTAGMDQRAQGVSMMGAAAGGLLGNALISAGVLPKPPEMERAEKMMAVRDEVQQAAAEQGIDPSADPEGFANLFASRAMKAGMEQEALMAIQWRDLQKAAKLAEDSERAKTRLADAQAGYYERGKGAGEGHDRGGYAVPVTDKDGTILEFDTRAPPGERLRDPQTGKPLRRAVNNPKYTPESRRNLAAADKYGGNVGEQAVEVDGKLDALDAVYQGLEMLDAGIYSGGWAEWKMKAAKLGPMDKTRAANTERFQSYLGDIIIPGLKEFGGNDSNEERAYLEKVRGGQITMEDKALRNILKNAERKLARGISRARKRAKGAGLPADEAPEESVPKAGALPPGWTVKAK